MAKRKKKPQCELVLGDFLAESPKRLKRGSIDLVVTSPPYNLGIDYNSYHDKRPEEEYLAWTKSWAREVKRVLAPKGSLFVNVGGKPSDPGAPWRVADVIGEAFKLQNVFHWIKSISIDKAQVGNNPGITQDVSIGHYKPVNSPRFVNDLHEYVFHFSHEGDVELDRLAVGAPYQDKSNVTRWKAAAADVHCRGNVWFIAYPTIQFRAKDRPHPATFPPRLPELCMRLHGVDRIARAMDPFAGLGSSAIAAAEAKVDFIGFELDEAYLDFARERLRNGAETAKIRAGSNGAK